MIDLVGADPLTVAEAMGTAVLQKLRRKSRSTPTGSDAARSKRRRRMAKESRRRNRA